MAVYDWRACDSSTILEPPRMTDSRRHERKLSPQARDRQFELPEPGVVRFERPLLID